MPKGKKAHTNHTAARKHKNTEEVDEGLRAIYGNDGEDEVDFSRLDKRNRTLSGILGRIALALGILSVVAWAAYFAYLRFAPQSIAQDIIITLEAPTEATSGSDGEIVLKYRNPKRTPIANLSVRAQLPDGFVLESSEPTFTSMHEIMWNLGSLAGESSGAITLKGTWIASVPSIQPIQFVSTYRPGNFNAEFTLVNSKQITVNESIAELTVTGPESLAAGELGSFQVAVQNTSTFDLPHATVTLAIPDGFFIDSIDPELSKTLPPTWDLPSLPAGGETQFTFTGSFASGEGGFVPFTTTLDFLLQDGFVTQQVETHTVDVAAGDIQFDLSLNGHAGSTNIAPGETVKASIVIENTTNTRITNAQVLMDFRSQGRMPIRWSNADYDGGKLTADGVLWDSSVLGALEPGQKIVLSPSFPISGSLAQGDATRLDIVLHLLRGTGDLKSDMYSIYIGEEARISGTLAPTPNSTQQTLTIVFSPPPQPLGDILISFELADGMSLAENPALSVGTGAYVNSSREWKWRIPTLPGNSAPLTARLTLNDVPEDLDERIFLRAIDPETLEEIQISAIITKSAND